MIILLSPAKKQDFASKPTTAEASQPLFQDQINALVNQCRQYSPAQLKELMSISESLAQLNWQRFQQFDPTNYTCDNAKQAIFAFQGDAYQGLAAHELTADELKFAQQHLRILSGLYGQLRPLDLIQPYRLEMKTKLATDHHSNLYQFWQPTLTDQLQLELAQDDSPIIINLASKEYSQAIAKNEFGNRWVDIDFKEDKDGQYKTIGIHAKRARGKMCRYLIAHKVNNLDQVKAFAESGYQFNAKLSSSNNLVFTR